MTDETHEITQKERASEEGGSRLRQALRKTDVLYGLFAVLVVAGVQIFFSVHKGGFFPQQWYWGLGAVAIAFVGAAIVPGYLTSPSVGRMQWVLAGTLFLLMAVVAASVLWSIRPGLSAMEAGRTAMYVGVFVLLLPAVSRWGWLLVDATIFGAFLPPAIYGLLQKIYPTSVQYTGFVALEADPKASSTVGYHPTFGMMCAMGFLLVVARAGAFRTLRSVPLRALYSAMGVVFLVAMYFSFSRGALLALAAGAVVLLALAKYRFEVLGNLAVTALPALWVVWQAREYPGLVRRPVSVETMQADGLALVEPLFLGVLLAVVAQGIFALLVRAAEWYVPEGVRRGARLIGTVIVIGGIAVGLFLGWNAFQQAGGFDELKGQLAASYTQSQEETLAQDQTQRFTSVSSPHRFVLWKLAWENWREHPFTGTGGDTFRIVFEENAPSGTPFALHPHSVWMTLLSDTGIFAFVAFAAFCVGCLALSCYNAFSKTRSRRSRALIAGSAAAATAYLVSSSIDWHWYIPASTVPFFALVAVAAGTTRRKRRTVPKLGL